MENHSTKGAKFAVGIRAIFAIHLIFHDFWNLLREAFEAPGEALKLFAERFELGVGGHPRPAQEACSQAGPRPPDDFPPLFHPLRQGENPEPGVGLPQLPRDLLQSGFPTGVQL